jgi:hypothetical protein
MNKAKLKKVRDKSAHRGKKKKTKKKKRRWEWKSEHVHQVLDGLGEELGDFIECGFDGAIIFIKPGMREGRHVMLTDSIGWWNPIGKPLLRRVKKVLEKDDDWGTWDIFEDHDD